MNYQLSKEEAIELYNSEWWKTKTDSEIALFQMQQDRLCLPFGRFHEAVEKALCRPVFTHEFANRQGLLAQLLGENDPPTMEDIINMIPKEKRVIIELGEKQQ